MKDIDYYLFWSEEFYKEHEEKLFLCETQDKMLVTVTHILMDSGEEDYKEDAKELTLILWEMIEAERNPRKF